MKAMLKKFTQAYGDLRLQYKIALCIVLTVLIPFSITCIFFTGKLRDMVISDTIRTEQDTSARTAPLIEDTIQQVLDAAGSISGLPFYEKLFLMPVNDPALLAGSVEAADFSASVSRLIQEGPLSAFQIYVDFPDNNETLQHTEGIGDYISSLLPIRGTYWYGIFQGSQVRSLFCPPFYLGAQEQKKYGDLAYIRSTTIYCRGEAYPCYLAFYYSSEAIREILVNNLTLTGSVSYIINERDSIVASSDDALSGIYRLSYASIQDSFMSSNNFIQRTILDKKIYAGFYSISQPEWFMVTVLPSEPLIIKSNRIIVMYFFLYLLILFLALFLATFLSRSITGRISSVIQQMQLIRSGAPVPMESPKYHDEIGNLIDTYNFMTRKMDHLMKEQSRIAEDLRISEFNTLQAQINPHFLYNTMDMINWLAQQGRADEVSDAVQGLSRFYKLTLSRKQTISSIAQEEEHVSIYIHLQNMRFHDNISFISDIPDELMDYQIPKLTLQPVVENAILHGILEKDSKVGTIVLTGWMEGTDIVLVISDDGVGMPPEKLEQILDGSGRSSSGGSNIAIYNTHRRLQILYGKEYGLSYSSTLGEGTEVQIRLPAKKEKQG